MIHIIPMPISKDYHIISFNREVKGSRPMVIMTSITEEEELLLDKQEEIKVKRGNKTFNLNLNNVYCYGQVDFHTGSDDMKEIANFDFLNYLDGFSGYPICSDYHYETHECHSPIKSYRITETWNPSVLSQYAHGCLEKPERIAIFKIYV